MDNAQAKNEDSGPQTQQPDEQQDHSGGRSGEGAASAMQQLIQNREHRHQTGEADDSAGGHGQ